MANKNCPEGKRYNINTGTCVEVWTFPTARWLLGVLLGAIIFACGLLIAWAWFDVLASWSGDWPLIVTVVVWFFIGGIFLIWIFFILAAMVFFKVTKKF